MSDQRDLRGTLRAADWEKLLPRLADYAAKRLRRVGWLEGEDVEPSAMSAQAAVNLAIERCLTDKRKWTSSAPDDLEVFLRGVIKSLVSSAKKSAMRDKSTPLDSEIGTPTSAPSPDEALSEPGRSAVCQAVEACVEGDPT